MISKVKIFSVVVLAFLCTLFALFSFGYYKAKRDIQRKLPNVKQLQYHDISAFSTKVYGGGCDVWFEYSYISFAFKVQNADDPEFVCEWILSKKGPKIIYGGWMEDVD